MGRELGRISGPLLAENLLRNGNNLAFDTDLLYLDVVDRRIGFKTDAPVRTLTVNSTARTDYLIAPNGNTEAGTFNLGFTSYQINNLLGNIVLAPNPASDPTVATPRIGTSELLISTSLIKNIVNNHDINLDAATGRQVIFTTDTLNIGGNLHTTGDITWDGNITFGNAGDEDDTVRFYSRVASSIIPDADSTYDLGRASPDRWRHLYTDNLDVSALIGVVDITITNLTVDGPGILRNNVTFPDNVVFNSTITNSLIPALDNTYKIGTSTGPKRWKTVFLTGLDVDGVIDIRNNRITTLDLTGVDGGTSSLTGSILDGGTSFGASPDLLDGGLSSSPFSVDLQLEADTTGRIYISGTDLQIDQNLTVEGNTVVTDVGITGQLDLSGNWNQTGTTQRTGDTDIAGSLTVNGANTVQFQEIKFVSNRVTTTTGTNNLELVVDGTNIVKTLLSDVEITNDLDVLLTGYTNTVNVTTVATADDFTADSIYIVDNKITTNTAVGANTDLELLANGAGIIHVTTTDVAITNDLTVDGTSTLTDINIGTLLTPAALSLTGAWNQTGAVDRTGNTDITGFIRVNGTNIAQFDNIKFDSNQIVATVVNSDLIFEANGTGIVKVLTSDVEIDHDLDVTGDGFFNTVNVDNTVVMDEFTIDDIYINDNKITTNTYTGPNTDLVLSANGLGIIHVTATDVAITNDLTVDGNSTLTDVNIGTLLTPNSLTLTGAWNQTGAVDRTGNTDITGALTVNGANITQFDNIKFDSNQIVATTTDSDLIFTANGTGIVKVLTSDVEITNDLDVTGDGFFNTVNVDNTVIMDEFTIDDIYINDNKITTNTASGANTDLALSANGSGIIHVTTTNVAITNDLTVNQLTTLSNVNIGTSVAITQVNQNLSGTSGPTGFFFYGWQILNPGQTVPTFSVIQPGWTVVGQPTWIVTVVGDGVTNYDITITGGVFASGGTYSFTSPLPSDITLTGNYLQTGAVNRTGNTDITGALTVNGANITQFDNIKFDSNQIVATVVDSDLIFTANGTGIVKVLTSDVEIDHDLDVTGDGFLDTVNVDNTVVMDEFTIDDIYINDNKITTNTASGANTNLVLQADGLGKIKIPLTDVVITNDLTVNSLTTLTDVNIGTVLTPNSLTLTGAWNQTGTIQRTGNTDITGSLTVNGDHTAQFENIKIINNRIVTTDTNSDLILEAIGAISAGIDGGSSLISIDDILDGGDAPTEQLAFINGGSSSASYDTIVRVINTDVQINNDLNVLLDITANSSEITLGVTAVDFNIGDLYIKNTISVVPGNTSLVLGATGNVRFKTSDVEITNNLTVAGPFTVNGTSDILYTSISGIVTQTGNIDQTGSTDIIGTLQADDDISITGASSIISVNAVKIDDNVISATATNSDLQFRASGTGGVALERYLKITNNEITNIFDSNNIELAFNNLILTEDGQNLIVESGDFYLADTLLDGDLSVILTPNGTGNVVINSNKAFAVAYGNNADRILKNVGEIRQNSITNVYEGKLGTGLVKFNNIYDTDGNTYITPELTPGANDDTIRFGINGVVKASVDSTKLFSNTLYADSVSISGTTISTLNSSNELLLLPSGAGVVKFNNVSFAEDYITNNTNSALVFASTGTGYVKFNGNNGIVFPSGVESLRYTTPELGETRYNTEGNYLEIFDGTNWISASGTSNVATLDEVQAELDLWSLVLG